PIIQWGPAVGDSGAETSRYIRKPEGLLFVNGKVRRLSPSDLASQATYDGDFPLAGVDDHYFLAAALSPGPSKVIYQPIAIPPVGASKDPPRDLVAFAIAPAAGDA